MAAEDYGDWLERVETLRGTPVRIRRPHDYAHYHGFVLDPDRAAPFGPWRWYIEPGRSNDRGEIIASEAAYWVRDRTPEESAGLINPNPLVIGNREIRVWRDSRDRATGHCDLLGHLTEEEAEALLQLRQELDDDDPFLTQIGRPDPNRWRGIAVHGDLSGGDRDLGLVVQAYPEAIPALRHAIATRALYTRYYDEDPRRGVSQWRINPDVLAEILAPYVAEFAALNLEDDRAQVVYTMGGYLLLLAPGASPRERCPIPQWHFAYALPGRPGGDQYYRATEARTGARRTFWVIGQADGLLAQLLANPITVDDEIMARVRLIEGSDYKDEAAIDTWLECRRIIRAVALQDELGFLGYDGRGKAAFLVERRNGRMAVLLEAIESYTEGYMTEYRLLDLADAGPDIAALLLPAGGIEDA